MTEDVTIRNVKVAKGVEHTVTSEGPAVIARSAVYYKVGGREYPMRSSPNCDLCLSKRRVEVENAILKGWAANHVAKILAEQGSKELTVDILNNHIRRGHMPNDLTFQRVAQELRATEMGLILEDTEGTIVDAVGVLRAVQQRGFERMVEHKIEPDMADTLSAAKALASFQAETASDTNVDFYRQALSRMIEVWEGLLQPEVFMQGIESLRADPILRGIDAQRRAYVDARAINAG